MTGIGAADMEVGNTHASLLAVSALRPVHDGYRLWPSRSSHRVPEQQHRTTHQTLAMWRLASNGESGSLSPGQETGRSGS
eukprot:1044773-Amphidinium_carterae.1